MENNELQHHGIPGMKWGIRRYQNKDGSLTKAGKKRYDKEVASLKEQQRIVNNKKRTQAKMDKLADMRKKLEDDKAALNKADAERKMQKANKKAEKRKLSEIPNDELMEKIDRLDLETKYLSSYDKRHPKDETSKEKWFTPALKAAGRDLTEKTIKKYGAKLLGLNEKEVKSAYQKLKEEAEMSKWKKQIASDKDFFKDRADKAAKNKLAEAQKQVDDYNKRRNEDAARESSTYRFRYPKDNADSGDNNSSNYKSSSLKLLDSHVSTSLVPTGNSFTSKNSNQYITSSSVNKGRDFTNVLFRGRMADGTEYTIEDRY